MCISPSYVWIKRGPNNIKQPKPCGDCWRCRKNRINSYTGRALCEASTSQHVVTLSLTYAPRDDMADKVLEPRHFQLFMKLLRRAGHKVRYLVAGEYGDKKGRAHFHCVLFFEHLVPLEYANDDGEWVVRGIPAQYKDDYPLGKTQDDAPFSDQIPQKRMVHIREWPHGHIEADWSASESAIRYVCWYLQAPEKHNAWFSLSKKPPLGAAYFAKRAEQFRESGLLPQGFEYIPPGGDKAKSYLLTGATRRDYLNAITQDPADLPKLSKWVRKTFEKYEKARIVDALKLFSDGLTIEEQNAQFIEAHQDDYARAQKSADWHRHQLAWDVYYDQFPEERPVYDPYAVQSSGSDGLVSHQQMRLTIQYLLNIGECSTYDELYSYFQEDGLHENFERFTTAVVNTVNAAREQGAIYLAANNPDLRNPARLQGPRDSDGRTAGDRLREARRQQAAPDA